MPKSKVQADPELIRRLEELKTEHGDTVRVDDIQDVVRSVMVSLKGDLTSRDLELYSELENLGNFIHSAKAEIAALRPDEVKEQFLTAAGDELDAIVEATAEATNGIMDATEIVEGVMSGLEGEQAERLMDATTRIYEACSFQDITGQRITKVVKALHGIEEKVDALVAAFGDEIEKYKKANPKEEDSGADKPITDEDLLEGPQLAGDGKSQDEIDALLASFD